MRFARLLRSAALLLCLSLGIVAGGPSRASEADHRTNQLAHAAHPDDAVKREEHAALLNLAPVDEATFIARQNGRWHDPATWDHNQVPADGRKVLIPAGVTVVLDERIPENNFEWVHVLGVLRFASDKSTLLNVTTLLVDVDGVLEVGEARNRVAPNMTAEIRITPRARRDRVHDPFDLAGGLLSHGVVRMYGAAKTSYVQPAIALTKGTQWITLPAGVEGWAVGDRVLFPGVDPFDNKDEVSEISEITSAGLKVRLAKPLAFDHLSPFPNGIPVSNLTRNVRIYSAETEPLAARGHVMFMHRQTGTVIDGVSFEGLGRTDALRAQTIPQLDANGILKTGTDDNTIGRYPLHFHVRSGARIEVPPHVVRNCVIIGSPKHGLVNHGGHVLAENNIGYQIAGSHFFAENGSEIGAFIGNIAVRSSGSGDRIRARDMTYDFGHGGHGFWTQSGGVKLLGNYAFGHAEGAFVIFGYPFVEQGRTVFFDGHNVGDPKYAGSLGHILISNVNFTFENNTAAGSRTGLEVWNHKIYTNHDEPSLVAGFRAWGIREYGVFLPYVKNVVLRNLVLIGDPKGAAVGLGGNTMTENLTIDGVSISGFNIGIGLPRRGQVALRNAILRNNQNIEIASANKPGRTIEIANVKFQAPTSVAKRLRQKLRNWWSGRPPEVEPRDLRLRDLVLPENGDVAMLFEKDRIFLSEAGERRQIFFESQLPGTVVLRNDGPSALQGLTAKEIFQRFGLAVGGQLAPDDAQRLAGSNGWVSAPVVAVEPRQPAGVQPEASEELYPMAAEHFLRSPQDVADAWKVVESQSSKVVFVDHEPPKFYFLPGLRPFEIHPDDVQYGYRIMGMVADRVGSKITVRAFAKEFHDLKVDPDGYIRLSFTVSDMAGNETKVDVALLVTERAVRRGANINFFVQKAYCGQCGYDTLYADIARMFDMSSNVSFVAQ
jgi:hypothetical protein